METEERIQVTKQQAEKVHKDEGVANIIDRDVRFMHISDADSQANHIAKVKTTSNGMYLKDDDESEKEQLPTMPFISSSGNVMGNVIPPKARTISQLMATSAVEDLVIDRGSLVSLFATDSILLALRTARESGMHAIPIYDPNDKFLGLFDCHDALAYFCCRIKIAPEISSGDLISQFLHHPISDVFGAATGGEKVPVMRIGTPITEVIKVLLDHSNNYSRRVEVVDPDHVAPSLYNVVSEMSVIKYIAKNISLLEREAAYLKVSDIMSPIIDVGTIPSDTLTKDAFEYLHNKISRDVGAAAVVDKLSGNIVDTLSASDIIGLTHDQAPAMLHHSIMDYLASTRRTKCLLPPVTVTMEDTLECVILKLSSVQVHRLWVVDPSSSSFSSYGRYLGHVTTGDVLSALSRSLELFL